MIISIIGEGKIKELMINNLKKTHGSNIVICDYNKTRIETVIEHEKDLYMMNQENIKPDLSKSENEYKIEELLKIINESTKNFNENIDNIVENKINTFINDNKDKVILLVSDTLLTKDIDKIDCLKKANIKIVIAPRKSNNTNSIFNDINLYNSKETNQVTPTIEIIKIKELIKK